MPRKTPMERPVTTSINIPPSLLEQLDLIMANLKIASRSCLITQILTDWVLKFQKKNNKKKRSA